MDSQVEGPDGGLTIEQVRANMDILRMNGVSEAAIKYLLENGQLQSAAEQCKVQKGPGLNPATDTQGGNTTDRIISNIGDWSTYLSMTSLGLQGTGLGLTLTGGGALVGGPMLLLGNGIGRVSGGLDLLNAGLKMYRNSTSGSTLYSELNIGADVGTGGLGVIGGIPLKSGVRYGAGFYRSTVSGQFVNQFKRVYHHTVETFKAGVGVALDFAKGYFLRNK